MTMLKLDPMHCEVCGWHIMGSRCGLNAHHIIARAMGGSDEMENIMTLCACCHAVVHGSDGTWSGSRESIVARVTSILDSVDYSNMTFAMPLIEMPATEVDEIPVPVQRLVESCKLHDAQSYTRQHEHDHIPMTPRAKVAFEIYRDLGRGRSLDQAANVSAYNRRTLTSWSSKYEWVRLCAEWDHKGLMMNEIG